jgi:hypothetical protein
MPREWHELTRITQGAPIVVERVRIADSDIAIEGSFDLPSLARLPAEDQVFIAAFVRCHGSIKAFVRCHGSIKEMERIFGISYPTVKKRLARLTGQIEFVETLPLPSEEDILTQLDRGEITAAEAIERLAE